MVRSLVGKRKGQQDSPHHVMRLEIFLWTVGVRVVATHTGLGQGLVRVQCLEDGPAPLGRHTGMGTIRIDQDFGETGSLEVGGRTIRLIDRPIADEPESNSIALLGNEPTRFQQELRRKGKPGGLSPVFCGKDDSPQLHPLHDVGGVELPIGLDHAMHIIRDHIGRQTGGRPRLLARGTHRPLTQQNGGHDADYETGAKSCPLHAAPTFLVRAWLPRSPTAAIHPPGQKLQVASRKSIRRHSREIEIMDRPVSEPVQCRK